MDQRTDGPTGGLTDAWTDGRTDVIYRSVDASKNMKKCKNKPASLGSVKPTDQPTNQ